MYKALSSVRLGFDSSLEQLVDMAVAYGFEGVEPSGSEFFGASAQERSAFLLRLRETGLRWSMSALPWGIGSTTTRAQFQELLRIVSQRAPVLALFGVQAFSTWIVPAEEIPFADALALHRDRIDRLTDVIGDHGLRLALEYIGPARSRAGHAHPFVHDLRGVRDLIAGTARPERVGLVLDTFHWHCAGETSRDLAMLSPDEIVAVDVNDALADRSRDEQDDLERALPAETGIIDAHAFVTTLRHIGFRGPLIPEPLAWAMAGLPPRARVEAASAGADRLLALSTG